MNERLLPPTVPELVEFYRQHPTARSSLIRAEFGWTAARYWQQLIRAMDTPEAERADPITVRAFRRRLEEQTARRANPLHGREDHPR